MGTPKYSAIGQRSRNSAESWRKLIENKEMVRHFRKDHRNPNVLNSNEYEPPSLDASKLTKKKNG